MSVSRAALFGLAASLVATPAALASNYPYDPAPVIAHDPKDAAAGAYKLEPAHTSVTMKLSHMGLSFYTIRFSGVRGRYDYDPAHPTASKIEIVIDPNSIDTGDTKFDALIAKKYFNSAKFPTITFTSTDIRAIGNHGTVEGVLDLHGIKKPIVLDVTYRGFWSEEKPERMGFSATTTLKRSDFGVDPYVPAESDEVTVLIETEFLKA